MDFDFMDIVQVGILIIEIIKLVREIFKKS